jgi:hypothetical protein
MLGGVLVLLLRLIIQGRRKLLGKQTGERRQVPAPSLSAPQRSALGADPCVLAQSPASSHGPYPRSKAMGHLTVGSPTWRAVTDSQVIPEGAGPCLAGWGCWPLVFLFSLLGGWLGVGSKVEPGAHGGGSCSAARSFR